MPLEDVRGPLPTKTHKRIGNNVALIEFQLSDNTSKQRVVFTINLGIICGALSDGAVAQKAMTVDAHLRQRFGFLLPERADKWWVITDQSNVIALADELSAALEEHAVPYLDEYLNPRSLITLWESGKSPGLTAVQREHLLERLKSAT